MKLYLEFLSSRYFNHMGKRRRKLILSKERPITLHCHLNKKKAFWHLAIVFKTEICEFGITLYLAKYLPF